MKEMKLCAAASQPFDEAHTEKKKRKQHRIESIRIEENRTESEHDK